jgi:hypothetical protein
MGFVVDTASNRMEALEKVRCRTYHVGMIDIMLTDDPLDRGGIDVIRYIASLEEGTRAIVLSASPDVRVPVEAWKEGALSYLIKKDIGSSEDICSRVKEAYEKCQIRPCGRFDSLVAYLAVPEQTPHYESYLMRVLRTDMGVTNQMISTIFAPLVPVLRRKNQRFSLVIDDKGGMAHGLLWSKALGHAVYVDLGRSDCEYIVPDTIRSMEPLFEREKGHVKGAVWRVIDKRDDFVERLNDV